MSVRVLLIPSGQPFHRKLPLFLITCTYASVHTTGRCILERIKVRSAVKFLIVGEDERHTIGTENRKRGIFEQGNDI